MQKNLSTRSLQPKSGRSLLKEECRWCQNAVLVSDLREHASKCSVNLFDDDDDTDTADANAGQTTSPTTTTQSSLNVDNSAQAQQPANVTWNQQSLMTTAQQSPLEQRREVASHSPQRHSTETITSQLEADKQTSHQMSDIVAVGDEKQINQDSLCSANLEDIVEQVVAESATSGNPVQILKSLQDRVVVGRALEVSTVYESPEGDVNFILVDRHNLLETAFDEVSLIKNPRLTLQVEFYGEVSVENFILSPRFLIFYTNI